MPISAQQLDWIRKHGIKVCPPGPKFRVVWGRSPRRHGSRELSDAGALESAGQLRVRSLLGLAFRSQERKLETGKERKLEIGNWKLL